MYQYIHMFKGCLIQLKNHSPKGLRMNLNFQVYLSCNGGHSCSDFFEKLADKN